jgi:transitional endoplasmic reticulum ATPase
MKKISESKPWQDHAAKSLFRVAETAGLAAVAIGAAWACRRWIDSQGKADREQESQSEHPAVTEVSAIKNEAACTKLSDVAGMQDVKTELHEKIIEPFIHPELFERFHLSRSGSGALLYGPPGNGKTFVAKAVAGELDAKFFPLNPADIKSKWVGETEKNLQRIFDEAKQHEKSVIFIDEADALLAARGNRKIGAVTQFLQLTDGLIRTKNSPFLLAATNKPWTLDEAVIRPGRLGTHIYVGPPDLKAREAILVLNLKGVPIAVDVSLAEISAGAVGYSGADLAEMCDRAKRAAKNRQLGSGKDEVVTKDDFAEALGKIRPSVSSAQLKQFEDWRKSRQRPSEMDECED